MPIPAQSFPAVIETIEYSPEVTDNVVTYKAVLTVDNSELLLRPGMTATAQIVTQEVPDALAVPNAALRYAPPREQKSQGFSVTSLFMPRMPRGERGQAPVGRWRAHGLCAGGWRAEARHGADRRHRRQVDRDRLGRAASAGDAGDHLRRRQRGDVTAEAPLVSFRGITRVYGEGGGAGACAGRRRSRRSSGASSSPSWARRAPASRRP